MPIIKSELKNLNNLLSLHLRRKHIIVLNPEKKEEFIAYSKKNTYLCTLNGFEQKRQVNKSDNN